MAVKYDKNVDYKALMDAAIAAGDYKAAGQYEQQRNAKIAGEGITDYQQTHDLGSVYDQTFMTNDELGTAYKLRQAADGDWTGAHSYAEQTRKNYGYSGGGDGSQYIPLEEKKTPSFSYQSAPAYVNQYQDLIDELRGRILEQDPFSYDPETDPAYQQYRDSYIRGGQRAMRDTLGQTAARTGGLASSYAGSVAQQTYDGYMSALADKIPQLRQLAYEMYQDEGDRQRLNLEMISALEREDYAKYQDLLTQYNSDRSFAYGQHRDEIGDARYDQEFGYQQWRDLAGDLRYADETAWNRDVYKDETDYKRAQERAKTLAAVGDFSGYADLGYSDEEIARLKSAYDLEHGLTLPNYSGGSGGWSGGGGSGGGSRGGSASAPETNVWAGVEDWVARYGADSAKNYIKEHYKQLGYSSQSTALAGWQNYQLSKVKSGGGSYTGREDTPVEPVKQTEPQAITRFSQLGDAAKATLNHVDPNPNTVHSELGRGIENKTITKAEADYVMRTLGYDGYEP